LRKPCSIPAGASTNVPGPAMASSSSPSWMWASTTRSGAISMIPMLTRGVSVVRARN
jgi:hypothetical protein